MGDSNMGRLPAIFDDKVQVECYPGGHWFHAYDILRKRTPTTEWIMGVILSFGINDRAYSSAEAVDKLVKKALVAESTYPKAQIHIPRIIFNRHLPKKQCTMLNQIKSHITSMGRALEVLPYEQFRTEQDFTHWTRMACRQCGIIGRGL